MIETIFNSAGVLIGKRLWGWSRAAGMIAFQFGGRRAVRKFRGNLVDVGDYAVHVQCAWRFVHEEKVIVGSEDIFYPSDPSEGNLSEFDWQKQPNRQDRLLQNLLQDESHPLVVERLIPGVAGRVTLVFSDGFLLELFPAGSENEGWRLFRPDTDEPHFVVFGSRTAKE